MELQHVFEIGSDVETSWRAVTDVERMLRYLPGAELAEVTGGEYRGSLQVAIGPLSTEYRGAAELVAVDPQQRRVALRAVGRDRRGHGNATVTLTALVYDSAGRTRISTVAEVAVTGRVARLGDTALDRAARQLGRGFVANLATALLAGTFDPPPPQHPPAIEYPPAEVEALNGAAAASVLPTAPAATRSPPVTPPSPGRRARRRRLGWRRRR